MRHTARVKRLERRKAEAADVPFALILQESGEYLIHAPGYAMDGKTIRTPEEFKPPEGAAFIVFD